ncbi:MAG: PQQ-dependent sugar dehydrogenase [Geminicoccales bacterium]
MVPVDQLYRDRLAQDTTSLFGSILRIDVDRGFPGYGIPDDNPVVGRPGLDEIYAYGFRNPYRIAFDQNGSGDLLATAIAETLWEAIYLIDRPGNDGWPIREGTHCVDRVAPRKPPTDCPRHGPDGPVANRRISQHAGHASRYERRRDRHQDGRGRRPDLSRIGAARASGQADVRGLACRLRKTVGPAFPRNTV